MQKFEYRTPRYTVDLPVQLNLAGSRIAGRCREISREGMAVEFSEPVEVDSRGTVSISYKNLMLELRVCVAHNSKKADGLRFLFETDEDRSSVERLVALLAGSPGQHGPVLVR
jgi:hypothetical protein